MKESEVAQSCPTLCGPMDCSPPGSSIHGIFQARVLEWVAISFSRWVIFLTLGSKPSLPHCRWILYQLNHKGTSPWNSPGQNTGVGNLSFSRGSSQLRDLAQVSCIAGRFFTTEPPGKPLLSLSVSLSSFQTCYGDSQSILKEINPE